MSMTVGSPAAAYFSPGPAARPSPGPAAGGPGAVDIVALSVAAKLSLTSTAVASAAEATEGAVGAATAALATGLTV